ncbi:hypothetical protein LCGC14_0251960 [marine sediment metagenome]|uniref:Uncharacterized protein n=1 Tax=marine sediment metagenome TaxID=412755 RepID=A0A0F9U937_9ZZZZ
MKTRRMKIHNMKIEAPQPETMDELREFVSDEDDLFFLALRGFDQVRMTFLRTQIMKGSLSRVSIRRLAKLYHYHRQTKFQP